MGSERLKGIEFKFKYPLVLVQWIDSQLGFQGWKWLSEQAYCLPEFVSVGFLIEKTKEYVVLYSNLKNIDSEDLLGSNNTLIPIKAIKKITYLT